MDPSPTHSQTASGWVTAQAPTLEYSTPRRTRPAVLTAVGIISIVLGSLGILRSVWQMLSLAAMLVISQMNFTMVPTTAGGGMTPAGTLNAGDADVIVAALSDAQALSAADQTRMAAALQQADIPFAAPPAGEPWSHEQVTKQITAAATAGSSTIYTVAGGTVRIDATEIEFVATTSGKGISTTTIKANGSVTGFSMPGNPFGGLSRGPLIASFAVELPNLGLAILLLVAGIATLRASPRSPALHRWWARLKLPTIAVSTAVGIWQAVTLMTGFGMTATQTTGGTTVTTPVLGGGVVWMMIVPAVMMALIACVYPIAVLFVFRARSVRDYYTNEVNIHQELAGAPLR